MSERKEGISLVFISQWGTDTEGINGGNVKKALSQIDSFRKNGFAVKRMIKEVPNPRGPAVWKRLSSKAKNILPFTTNQSVIRYSDVGEADCYYIRFRAYDYHFYKLVKAIRDNNPKAKIALEYSDYPYLILRGKDKIGDRLVRWRDDKNRNRTLKYVDRIVTLRSDETLDGLPCLRIYNGLDISGIPVKKDCSKDSEIHVLIVASLQPAHGVDRFIAGMKEYYKKEHSENVFLHVVGGGSICEELKTSAAELGDKVVFHGFMHGSELDEMYDRCDIGIEILAPQRKGILVSASLKSREYVARGLPFVSACRLDICDLGFNEYCRIDESENPVDINVVIDYYHDFLRNRDARVAQMREFAETYLSMDYAMRSVTEYFRS